MNIRTLCGNLEKMIQIISSEKNVNSIFDKEFDYTVTLLNQALDSLKSKFSDQAANRENTAILCELLAKRWEWISDTGIAYAHAPVLPANLICLILAQELEHIHGKSRYQLLMPTIQVVRNEISSTELNEHTLELKEFILSDDNQRIIDIVPCMDFAVEDGELKHTSLFDGHVRKLSDNEVMRITQHSRFTDAYYKAICELVEVKKRGSSFGAILTRLMDALRAGGAHGNQGGQELNAAATANEQIFYCSEWLSTLTEKDRERLFQCRAQGLTHNYGEIWGRLARPNAANYINTIYCVELIAGELSQILSHNQWLFDAYPENSEPARAKCIMQITQNVKERRQHLVKALREVDYLREANYLFKASYGASGNKKICHYLKLFIKDYLDLLESMFVLDVQGCGYLLEILGSELVKNSVHLIIMSIGRLPDHKKNIFIRGLRDKLVPLINSNYLFAHLYIVVPAETRSFLADLFRQILFENAGSADELIRALQYYPDMERLDICVNYSHRFTSLLQGTADVCALLSLLRKEDRLTAMHALFEITKIVKNGFELANLMSWIDPAQKRDFLRLFSDNLHLIVRDATQLMTLLVHIPQDIRLTFIQDTEDWIFDLIQHGRQLAVMLIFFPPAQRITLLNMIGDDLKIIIQLSDQLALCIAALPETDQTVLLELIRDALHEIIMDEQDLIPVLRRMSVQNQVLLNTFYKEHFVTKKELESSANIASLRSSVRLEEPRSNIQVEDDAARQHPVMNSAMNHLYSFFNNITQQFAGPSSQNNDKEEKRPKYM